MAEPAATNLDPCLSVVVPVYNERDNIVPLIEEISASIGGALAYEIVYVNDCSDDGTDHALDALCHNRSLPLTVVTHETRQGQSAAIVSGIRAARGEWVATMDGDGQNVPTDILRLLQTVRAAHDRDRDIVCVAGIRSKRRDNIVRIVSSRIANGIRQGILRDGISDTGCGLKVFRRAAFLALPHFDHIHRFIPALFQMCGGRVISESVAHRPRLNGKTKYGISNRLFTGVVDLAGVSWLRSRAINRPWRIN